MDLCVKSRTAGNHSILTLSKVPQPTAVRSYIRCTAVLFTIYSCTGELWAIWIHAWRVVPVVHFSASLFTGPKPTMLAVPFPPGSLNKYPLFTDAWAVPIRKTPDVLPLQEPRAKMPAARYIKIDRPHAENSPCLVRTEKSMRLAIVQELNTGWHRYKYAIINCTAPPAITAGLRFSGITKPETSSICQQQCLFLYSVLRIYSILK